MKINTNLYLTFADCYGLHLIYVTKSRKDILQIYKYLTKNAQKLARKYKHVKNALGT
jgi:hypothetical protein